MVFILLIHLFTVSFALAAPVEDASNQILLLKPKQGQNYEQDLLLAKAYLSLERRAEAQKLLNEMLLTKKDDRVLKLRDLSATQFFDQETANFYYEAVRHLSGGRWVEAKERLDQAIKQEPGQGLVLLRMIQIELYNGAKGTLEEHITQLQQLMPNSIELKAYSGRENYNDEEYREAFRIFLPIKDTLLQNETGALWWLDALLKVNRMGDIALIQNRMLKDHPSWSSVLLWFLQGKTLSAAEHAKFTAQLTKNLKDPEKFKLEQENEGKRTQYFWEGYVSYDLIKTEFDRMAIESTQKTKK